MKKESNAHEGFNKKSCSRNLTIKPTTSVYEIITSRIIERLEQGEIVWKKSWNSKTQAPRNLVSKKLYNGVNIFLLASMRYQNPNWLTYNQAKALGGTVRKGEKSCPVIFWSFTEKEDADGTKRNIGFLRYYSVFNVAQINGLLNVPDVETINTMDSAEEYDLAQEIADNMPTRPEIRHGFSRACYCPSSDTVQMPNRNSFIGQSEYFSVLYHELAHSVDHETRLNSKTSGEINHFGDPVYSKNELIAEFTSAFLCAEAGISQPELLENQTAYIQGWLKALRNDSKLLISSAALAQKASDYILGRNNIDPVEE